MPKNTIYYTPSAEVCLESIFRYIAEDSLYHATRVIESIEKSISFLEEFPHIGTRVSGNDRYIVESQYKYKITYRIDGTKVIITTIFKYKNL